MKKYLFLLIIYLSSPTTIASTAADALAPEWKGSTFRIPLEIRDNSGVNRVRWPVTSGVPLPQGSIKETSELRLLDENGTEVPAQFRATTRHWAQDNSIKWLLLDFQIDVSANDVKHVYLTNDRAARHSKQRIRIKEDAQAINIDTGPLDVRISKKNAAIFERVRIDGKTVIQAKKTDGPNLVSGQTNNMLHYKGNSWNTHGWTHTKTEKDISINEHLYRGDAASQTVSIETRGPLRTVVKITGRHMPTDRGNGIVSRGMYLYTTRIHFYQGHSFINVEHSIENTSPQQPQWNYMFREAALSHNLTFDGQIMISGGGATNKGNIKQSILPQRQNAGLYQGVPMPSKTKNRKKPAISGGYQLKVGNKIIDKGQQGRFLDISDHAKGLTVATRYMWQKGPKTIEYKNGTLKVAVHGDPQHDRQVYGLDLGQRSLHSVLYYFHKGDALRARSHDIAQAYEYPLFARASPAWYASSQAWYFEMSTAPEKRPRRRGKNDDHAHWQPIKAGAFTFGANRSFNSGGHHLSLNSTWLDYLRGGRLKDFERNLALSRWSISNLPGLAYHDNTLKFGDNGDKYGPLDAQILDWNNLTAFGPKSFYLWQDPDKKKNRSKSYLNGYKVLPDMEHYAHFQLFEYYYLFGDPWALDSIRGLVNWDVSFQNQFIFERSTQSLSDTGLFSRHPERLYNGHYSRVYTWMLYTNLAGFHATGDEVYDHYTRWQIRRMLALLRDRHGQLTSVPSSAREAAKAVYGSVGAGDIKGAFNNAFGALSDIFISEDGPPESRAQSWMEAQGPLALHEAYKTYNDERILDALWAQADYFSNHVIYFPKLGMLNNRTSMPNQYLGGGNKNKNPFSPIAHDRHLQSLPILYHYTGWQELKTRYDGVKNRVANASTWFQQTGDWLEQNNAKKSNRPPRPITDLKINEVTRDTIRLTWTSPSDDSRQGKAARYFVKISDKPIVQYAPTDNPEREVEKMRIIKQADDLIFKRIGGNTEKKRKRLPRKHLIISEGDVDEEDEDIPLAHPDWHNLNAFWMAEHVAGEPIPSPAGQREQFNLKEILPHNWFGLQETMPVEKLSPGTYYIAVSAWDEDQNLSPISNVVQVLIQ